MRSRNIAPVNNHIESKGPALYIHGSGVGVSVLMVSHKEDVEDYPTRMELQIIWLITKKPIPMDR